MYLSIVDSIIIKEDKKNAGSTLPRRATGIDKDKHAYTLTSDGFIENHYTSVGFTITLH